jgi:hypothetical protein
MVQCKLDNDRFEKLNSAYEEKLRQYRLEDKMSRPEIGLHELTCKQDEKSEKNRSRTGSDNC